MAAHESLARVLSQLAAVSAMGYDGGGTERGLDVRAVVVEPLFRRVTESLLRAAIEPGQTTGNLSRHVSNAIGCLLAAFRVSDATNRDFFIVVLNMLEEGIDEGCLLRGIVVATAYNLIVSDMTLPQETTVSVVSKLLGLWTRCLRTAPTADLTALLSAVPAAGGQDLNELALRAIGVCFEGMHLRGTRQILILFTYIPFLLCFLM